MSVRTIRIHKCDRCKEDYNPNGGYGLETIGHLAWMVLNNGSGSADSHMSLDLCERCTIPFLKFMKGE